MSARSAALFVGACVVALAFLSSIPIAANQFGRTEATRKNGTGCNGAGCHGTFPSSAVQVFISGPDTVVVGQSAIYTVSISGGPAKDGGTNIAASKGILSPVDTLLKEFRGELTHERPTPFPQTGSLQFRFRYTAPLAAGLDTIFANGNSVNGDRQPTGDQWNFAPDKRVTIVPSVTSVSNSSDQTPKSFFLFQNYPNPFNPSTRIAYELPFATHVTLKVFDLSGKEIVTLVDDVRFAGRHETEFLAPPALSSGTYLYTITYGKSVDRKLMTLLK